MNARLLSKTINIRKNLIRATVTHEDGKYNDHRFVHDLTVWDEYHSMYVDYTFHQYFINEKLLIKTLLRKERYRRIMDCMILI